MDIAQRHGHGLVTRQADTIHEPFMQVRVTEVT
jgi:hypothetical protein